MTRPTLVRFTWLNCRLMDWLGQGPKLPLASVSAIRFHFHGLFCTFYSSCLSGGNNTYTITTLQSALLFGLIHFTTSLPLPFNTPFNPFDVAWCLVVVTVAMEDDGCNGAYSRVDSRYFSSLCSASLLFFPPFWLFSLSCWFGSFGHLCTTDRKWNGEDRET